MEKKDKEMVDFIVTARKYKTQLTKKFENRKAWKKPYQGDVVAHLPGTILEVAVKEGQAVKAGDLLLIHEAMKMKNRVVAPISGQVTLINVKGGEHISKNYLMVKIEK